MTEELLIKLLEEQIFNLEEEIKNYKKNPILEKYERIIKSLKKDKNNITEIDLSIIEEILDELQVIEKEEILNNFDIIQKLLILNKEKHTTYKLTESQLEYINLFIEKIDNYERKNIKKHENRIKYHKEYNNLLNKLTNKQEKITELNTIKHLFKDLSITEKDQSRILIILMKHNKSLPHQTEILLPNWDI